MAEDQNRELQLKFVGHSTDGHCVPASVLTQSLQALQRAVYLLGMRHEGKDVRQRLRISSDVETRYSVLCKIPEEGSFISPITIGDTSHSLFDGEAVSVVTDDLLKLLSALSDQDDAKVRSLLPDPVYRTPVLASLAKMAPPKRSGIEVDLQTRSGQSLFAPARIAEFIAKRPTTSDATVTTVTGRLIGIDFADHMLRLHYPPTMRELKCYYHDAVEEMLLDNPREYIQVVGQVILGKDGEPERITEVDRILEVDLSPIEVITFETCGRQIHARRPISIVPTLDETAQFYCISFSDFGIDIIESTREELERDLYEELDMLWRQYALEQDDTLTDGARILKHALLDAFEELPQ